MAESSKVKEEVPKTEEVTTTRIVFASEKYDQQKEEEKKRQKEEGKLLHGDKRLRKSNDLRKFTITKNKPFELVVYLPGNEEPIRENFMKVVDIAEKLGVSVAHCYKATKTKKITGDNKVFQINTSTQIYKLIVETEDGIVEYEHADRKELSKASGVPISRIYKICKFIDKQDE